MAIIMTTVKDKKPSYKTKFVKCWKCNQTEQILWTENSWEVNIYPILKLELFSDIMLKKQVVGKIEKILKIE